MVLGKPFSGTIFFSPISPHTVSLDFMPYCSTTQSLFCFCCLNFSHWLGFQIRLQQIFLGFRLMFWRHIRSFQALYINSTWEKQPASSSLGKTSTMLSNILYVIFHVLIPEYLLVFNCQTLKPQIKFWVSGSPIWI